MRRFQGIYWNARTRNDVKPLAHELSMYNCWLSLCVRVCVCVCVCVRACVHVCEAHSWHFILLYVNTYFVYYLLFIYFYYPSREKPSPLFNLRLFRSDRRILWVNRSPPFSQFARHASVTSHTPMKGFTLKKCCQDIIHTACLASYDTCLAGFSLCECSTFY